MMIQLRENMEFKSKFCNSNVRFKIKKSDYYHKLEQIWCAYNDEITIPLSQIDLDNYIPMVDGVWINEPNEYF